MFKDFLFFVYKLQSLKDRIKLFEHLVETRRCCGSVRSFAHICF